MLSLSALLFWLFLATNAYGAPLEQRGSPERPSEDPFYALPEGLDKYQPGTVLRHRNTPFPIAVFGIDPVRIQASHQFLYKTVNSLDNSTATVVTILIPYNADYGKILSYQVAQDSASVDCAPSYALQLGPKPVGIFGPIVTSAEFLLMEAALDRGWVVIVPDHEGPHGSFAANNLAGHAILDGIRVALNSTSVTGIKKNANVALWGYSGGSITTAFAAELHPTYAPELNIVGAAMGGIVPDLKTTLKLVSKSIAAGLAIGAVVGWMNEYPVIKDLVNKNARPEVLPLIQKVENQCLVDNVLMVPFLDIYSLTRDPTIIDTDPDVNRIMKENSMGKSAPKVPLFIYQSVNDEFTPIKIADAVVDSYCQRGTPIVYQRDILSEHGVLAVTGAAKAFSFLIDRMTGRSEIIGCTKRTVASSLLDPSTLEVVPRYIVNGLLALLGKPIGLPF